MDTVLYIYMVVSCLVKITKLRVDLTMKFNNCIVLIDDRRSQKEY